MPAVVKEREASLTAARLREVVDYDPTTGVFRWKEKKKGWRVVGAVAGTSFPNGYRFIGIEGYRFLGHRLAWLYATGEWPKDEIDHINGDKSDNRIANLRPVTRQQNNWNGAVRAQSTSGHRHIFRKRTKWAVRILAGTKSKFHGVYVDLATAIAVRDVQVAHLRGEYRPLSERRA